MDQYFINQAGDGIGFYRGRLYQQRGRGWFGRIFSGTVLPFLRYLGNHALSSGADVVKDVVAGDNIKTAVKRRARGTVSKMLGDAVGKLQSGTGIKRQKVIKGKRKAQKICVIPRKKVIKRNSVARKSKYDFLS